MVRYVLAAALAAALMGGCVDPNDPSINPKAAAALGGWQDLLTAEAMSGWRLTPTYTDAGAWKAVDGAVEGTHSWMGHERNLDDFILEGEFLHSGKSQGGIVLRGDRDSATPWVSGYELDIDRSGDRGHLHLPCYPKPHVGDAKFDLGEWHRLRIEARGATIRIALNGREVLRLADDRFRYGQICLEGEPGGVRYRNFRVISLSSSPPSGPRSPWRDLFDGKSFAGWQKASGDARIRRGAAVLGGIGKKAILLLAGANYRNGQIEFDVWRRDRRLANCYSFGVRTRGGLAWRSLYVVVWPWEVGFCRGSAAKMFPELEKKATLGPSRWPVTWRLVMDEGDVTMFRNGEKMLTYRDPKPEPGTIGITADGCELEVRAVRYRPLSARAKKTK